MVTANWSDYQVSIFNHIEGKKGSAIIQAVAGSGKTTTIVEAIKKVDPRESAIFLAFNKSIATELQKRGVDNAKTFHSAAWSKVMRRFKGIQLNDYKVLQAWDAAVNLDLVEAEETALYKDGVVKLVGIAKNSGLGACLPLTVDALLTLVDHYDIQFEGEDITRAATIAKLLLEASRRNTREADFNDMLYFVVAYDIPMDRHNWVFVDESQDTNMIQREILRKLLATNGTLIAVGDIHQAIYGFRGADAEAMQTLAKEFNCVELPLSISYRCPQAVVREAQNYVSGIQSAPNAVEGSVTELGAWGLDMFTRNDAILCRNTAPLIKLAYKLVAYGTGVKVIGRDFGAGLISLIKKLNAKNLSELEAKLSEWRQREVSKALAKQNERKAETINDKADSLQVSIEAMHEGASIPELMERIKGLFSDKDGLLSLSTMHRSKGLEWNTVYILDRQLLPSKYAKQEWQLAQEHNLGYVAVTRAKQNLVYISSEQLT